MSYIVYAKNVIKDIKQKMNNNNWIGTQERALYLVFYVANTFYKTITARQAAEILSVSIRQASRVLNKIYECSMFIPGLECKRIKPIYICEPYIYKIEILKK